MKLFLSPGACSTSCHIAFEEAKLNFEPVIGDWESVNKLNPMGTVPVLQFNDGKTLTQNIAILTYAADQAPSLLPQKGTYEYYQAYQWLAWTSSDLHPTIGELYVSDLSEETKQDIIKGTQKLLAQAEKHLEGRTYLAGDHFTIADALFFVVSSWTRKLNVPTDQFPNINTYKARIAERPAVIKAMKREGLI